MTTWQNILGVAAIGTERQELTLPPCGSLLGRALNGLDVSDREGALLGAAALASLHERAGMRPAADTQPLPEAAAEEQTASCSAAASQHLALMLAGEFKEVLPEWLLSLHIAGRRVPEEHLPSLLDKASAERAFRQLVVAVIGNRGHWLAAQNETWRWACANAEPGAWETGGRDERILLLRSLRETEPQRARELLSSTWKDEPAKDRQTFLRALDVGLSNDDEPFLTEALQDRSAEVRRSAVDALLRLPSSRFTRHVSERVTSLLNYRKPTLRKALLEVTLPKDPEKWQKENQILLELPANATAPRSLGKKGWWLLQAIGCVPPSDWCAAWGKRPEEVLAAAANSEWRDALLSGMAAASLRHADARWIEAILSHQETRQSLFSETNAKIPELASRLPANLLEAIILKELAAARKSAGTDHSTVWMLTAHRKGWSEELSRTVVATAKGLSIGGRTHESIDWQLMSALKQFALYVPPALADELSSGWPVDVEGFWQRPIEEFQTILGFRRDMLRALAREKETEV
jgi:hypothetical protein